MTSLSITRLAPEDAEFDYSSLPLAVEKFLKGQATRIRQYGTKAIIQIGKDLVGAKHYLSHGEFLRWVEYEVGIPARTAQAYMRVASWASSKSATVALLPPTVLYALSSPDVPPEFVKAVLKRAESGERIALPLLRAQIKALRDSVASHADATGENAGDVAGAHCATATTAVICDVVRTLAHALTSAEFELMRRVITSKAVLTDPHLPAILARVFGSYSLAASPSAEPAELYEMESYAADLAPVAAAGAGRAAEDGAALDGARSRPNDAAVSGGLDLPAARLP